MNEGCMITGQKVIPAGEFICAAEVEIRNGAVLTVEGWNGKNGGVLFIKCHSLRIEDHAEIDLRGKGYGGGSCSKKTSDASAYQGESYLGTGKLSQAENSGGGGGGICSRKFGSTGGGGGGYGSNGKTEISFP